MRFLSTVIIIFAVFLAGCAARETVKANDALTEAKAYYKAHPEFFIFSKTADLPKDLAWQDGHNVETFSDPSATRGGVLHDFINDFPRTLRVVGPDSNGSFRGIILDGNSLGLLGFHPNTDAPFPALAKQWAVSTDKKTVYFKLDEAAKFSDGEKITAENYFFGFYFFRSSHIHDPWYTNFYTTEYQSVTRYDDLTLAITLPRARPDFLEKAAGIRPLPMSFYKELGDDYPSRYQWQFEPTTGPYELLPADLKKGRSITLRRINNWWAEHNRFFKYRFNPDALEFTVIRDVNKAFEIFLSGQIDAFALGLPEYWYDRAPQSPAVKNGWVARTIFYNDTPRPTWGMYINTQDEKLKEINLRKGIAAALNWDEVLKTFFRGDSERMPSYGVGYGRFTNPNIKPQGFDLNVAAENFAKAGYTKRGKDGILEKADGTRLSLSLTASDGPMTGLLMILKQEALKAGLELNLDILDGTTAFKKISEKKHQIAFMAFGASPERYPRYWEMFHGVNAKPQTNNLCNLTDPTVDALIERYDQSIDEEEIKIISWKLQEKINDSAAYIPGFMRPYYRIGYWRWIKFPKFFDVKTSSDPLGYGLFWIDEKTKRETINAREKGQIFDNSVKTFEQFRQLK